MRLHAPPSSLVMVCPKYNVSVIAHIPIHLYGKERPFSTAMLQKKFLKFIEHRSSNISGIHEPENLSWLPHLPTFFFFFFCHRTSIYLDIGLQMVQKRKWRLTIGISLTPFGTRGLGMNV